MQNKFKWSVYMKKILFIGLLAVNLSGCVGIYSSSNGDVVESSTDFSRTDLRSREMPPSRAPDKINADGSEMYVINHELQWCGLTIWAVVPIPLWLPLCKSHTEVTYKDGKAILMASQWPTGSGFLCGPFVPIMGIDGGSKGFCRSVK